MNEIRCLLANPCPHALVAMLAVASLPVAAVAQLTVVATTPAINAGSADFHTSIEIQFDRPVDPSSFTDQTFWAFGRSSGTALGSFEYSNGDQTVALRPNRRFQPGETVTVFVANSVKGADASSLRLAGYSWQFTTRVRPAGMDMIDIDTFSNRIDNAQTRIYGGITTDFDGDGWVDIATINEVSADMRMFLNRADGSGLFQPMLTPPAPLLTEVSPNEPCDFNRDGNADFAVASSLTSHICILLGNGDGTFAPGQFIPAGTNPHGVAVADVDGDGDADVMTASSSSSNISLYLNNGAGVFGSATAFEGGGSGEYGLIAAEMNNDGILDIIVGCNGSQTAVVHLGDGDGTFTAQPSQSIGGPVWVINAADLNGDGDTDIASANSFANNGAILFGNGAGGLSAPVTYSTPGHTPSTDLGDLDGDGDLDWILSSYGGGAWRLFENNGSGTFSFVDDVPAADNPACAAFADTDNDGDLDIILFDEIADTVTIYQNTAVALSADFDLDGDVDLADFAAFAQCFAGAVNPPNVNCPPGVDADLDDDGDVDLADFADFAQQFTG